MGSSRYRAAENLVDVGRSSRFPEADVDSASGSNLPDSSVLGDLQVDRLDRVRSLDMRESQMQEMHQDPGA